MTVLKAAKEMLEFIKRYPQTKAVSWPTEEQVRQWELQVGGHQAMEKLLDEEFDQHLLSQKRRGRK